MIRASEEEEVVLPALNYLKAELEGRENLIWTGYLSPDTDTSTASLLAALIYGGQPAVPGPINPEPRFALDACNAEEAPFIEDFSVFAVGLAGFNQSTQLPPSVDPGSIVAVIDHDAIGGSPINLADVISIEIRPWGSVVAILADEAVMLDIELPFPLACMAMAATLSDTVNLTLPTKTEYDRAYMQSLVERAGIDDIDGFAEIKLPAKSDLSGLSADEIVLLDYRFLEFGGQQVGIGVAETLTAQHKVATGLDHVVLPSSIPASRRLS